MKIMRLIGGLFTGFVAFVAFGNAIAHAQESSGRYWINPALTSEWRTEQPAQQPQQPVNQEDLALGFTLNGFAGITGELELGRVTINPDAADERISTYGHAELGGGPVDEPIGEATINWNVTDRLQLSTSYARAVADPTLFSGTPVFEDEFSGGVTYAITPRFAVSARGTRRLAAENNTAEGPDFTGEGAALNAEYQFMPYVSGSVNYSYESYDGQEGVLRRDESTLSLSLTGRF